MLKVLIIGATSAIAEACARRWACQGAALYLLARDVSRLSSMKDDLSARGASEVRTSALDVNDTAQHTAALEQARIALGHIDVALIAHGSLPDQRECDASIERCLHEFATNGSSTIALMTGLAELLRAQGRGTLAVISSVAGDRGRATNAIYGAAKAAVNTYASALRQRLWRSGVDVVTIKPGWVDSPMTSAFTKGILWTKPDTVARGIVAAIRHRRTTAYLPWFWRPIFLAIRCLPEFLFKRLRF